MNKVLKFEHPKIVKLLKENKEISEQINVIVEEWQKKDQEVKKMSMKMERIKEKIRPLVAEEIKKRTTLEEFDIVQSTKLEKDKVVVEIMDQIELIKHQIREKKNAPQDAKD